MGLLVAGRATTLAASSAPASFIRTCARSPLGMQPWPHSKCAFSRGSHTASPVKTARRLKRGRPSKSHPAKGGDEAGRSCRRTAFSSSRLWLTVTQGGAAAPYGRVGSDRKLPRDLHIASHRARQLNTSAEGYAKAVLGKAIAGLCSD